MTILVVGGHARKVGKTAVAAGIIAAFPGADWTAVKISSHFHGKEPDGDCCLIREETSRAGESDSSRFLAAGARRAFWVRVDKERAGSWLPRLEPILKSSPFLILEGNDILNHVRADLHLMVLRYGVAEFKESARALLGRADALVAIGKATSPFPWDGAAGPVLSGIPVFTSPDPQTLPAGLVAFLASRFPGLR
ncbi:MAG: hypothetical protein QM330_09770 [Acidobacteriota bacterium]|jgi:hypothetical protein|nr:hypothetical protein [Acidobacteriota bacterium]NLT34019.1 hypothetical protein [Acidobacteriota bacterium]